MATVLMTIKENWTHNSNWRQDEGWKQTADEVNQEAFTIQFKKEEGAKPPRRKYPIDAGFDLAIKEDIIIQPWEMIKIGTGVQFKIPDGYYGQIYPRSSMAKVGLRTEGGVIDASYRGEVQLMLSNRDPKRAIHIYAGDYIAQMVIIKICEQDLEEVQELN